MTKWLSNKWNLIGIYALCSFCIGYILYDKLTFTELLLIYTLMSVSSLVIYILGVSRGMFLYATEQDRIERFWEIVRKVGEDESDDED